MKSLALLLSPLVVASCFQGGSGEGRPTPDANPSISSDGGSDGAVEPPAPDAGFLCNDDSELEPNDLLGQAADTGIPGVQDSIRFVGLAICPASDVDMYKFTMAANGGDVTVTLDYDTSHGALVLTILNGTGAVIATGGAVGGNQDILRASIPNLPTGTYYAAVQGEEDLENNYNIEVVTAF